MPVTLFRLVLFGKGFIANGTIRYRITPSKCDHLGSPYMPFKKQKSPHFWDNHYPGLPSDWNFLVLRALKRRDLDLSVRGLGLFLASVGSFVLFAVFGADPEVIAWLFTAGVFSLPASITRMKKSKQPISITHQPEINK